MKRIALFLTVIMIISAVFGCSVPASQTAPADETEPDPSLEPTPTFPGDNGEEAYFYGNFGVYDIWIVMRGTAPGYNSFKWICDSVFYTDLRFSLEAVKDGQFWYFYNVCSSSLTKDEVSEISRIHRAFCEEHYGKDLYATLEPSYPENNIICNEAYYYGNFGGCEVWIRFHGSNLDMYVFKEAAGSVFFIDSDFELEAIKDGRIMSIFKAYEDGLLTEEDMAEISRLHKILCDERYGKSLYEDYYSDN